MTIKEMRTLTEMSQAKFGEYFGIPMRTIQNWENDVSKCPQYVVDLIKYKLIKEQLIFPKEP